MSSLLKKIKYKKLIFTFIYLLSFTDYLFSQEKYLLFKVSKLPSENNFLFLDTNNNGIKNSNIVLGSKFKYVGSQTEYQLTTTKTNEKIYFGESFIKKTITENTFIQFGKYYRNYSNYLNDNLSSGHMIISKNAEPIPKIGFVTSKKINSNNNVSFDFGLSHGQFSKEKQLIDIYGEWRYSEAPILHEKFIYLNLINDKYTFSLGLVHSVMWGGEYSSEFGSRKFPVTLENFFKVLIAADGYDEGGSHQNSLGNHIGIWDFSILKKHDNRLLKLYYQHIFEDTSGLRFANQYDGLWGFESVNYKSNTNFLIEYLSTSNVSAESAYLNDRYYTNYQYKLGWSYKGYTLGNPYIDHLSFSPVDAIHFGINTKILSQYLDIKMARRVSINDDWNYKISLENNRKNFSVFFVKNHQNQGAGLTLSIQMKNKK